MRGAWYNEPDRHKAATLRLLIEAGAIAHGVVDERPIQAIAPEDLAGFVQCHFFAGGGVWSYALRLAGWPDERPVWTGSCPCGPFSAAGKKLGFEDPRHLWPAWVPLIRVCRPDRIFGEQSDDAHAWIDLISSDLEDLCYAIGTPDIPAAGFGGAHVRQRYYWVADAHDAERWAERAPWHDGEWPKTGRVEGDGDLGERSQIGGLGDSGKSTRQWHARDVPGAEKKVGGQNRSQYGHCSFRSSDAGDVDWLPFRDGLWRPVEPGTFPLAHEAPARMGRLRLFGDAIDAETAANFIGAYMDVAP